ncbi:MAG: SPASM domain-containing protein [Cystobacterineae bacterium]|nr:SPASM domain-containing protein [Cystobacterineae bacterium]
MERKENEAAIQKRKKRVFVSSGLFSLLNIFTLREQFPEDADDVLLISDEPGNNSFYKYHKELAIGRGFSEIMPTNYDFSTLNKHILFDEVDEVYTISHYFVHHAIQGKFKRAKYFFIEEGLTSYIKYYDDPSVAGALFLLMHDKFDFINDKNINIKKLDKNIFRKIASDISLRSPIHIPFSKSDKVILFLSQYNLFLNFGSERAVSLYKESMRRLIDRGYKLIFKVHPRHTIEIQSLLKDVFPPSHLYFLDNILPSEIYDFDVVAVVSFSSGGLLTMSHLYNIPAFHIDFNADFDLEIEKFFPRVIKEYTPNIREIFELKNDIAKEECRYALDQQFKKFLKNKPLLSENAMLHEDLDEIIEHVIYQTSKNLNKPITISKKQVRKLCDTLRIWDVPKFSQLHLEMTNHCGFNWSICPRKNMTRSLGIMPIEDLSLLMDKFSYINYELDVHLHGHGETLLCNDLPERIRLITSRKQNFTPCIFTTLSYSKSESWFESLVENGLGKIIVSTYGYDKETYKTAHGVDRYDIMVDNLKVLASFQKKYRFKLHVQLNEFEDNELLCITQSEHQELRNRFRKYLISIEIDEKNIGMQPSHKCGSENFQLASNSKMLPCSVCWGNRRSHIFVSWDLNVYPCVYDYNGAILWGNLKKDSLEEIYRSPSRMRFIESLMFGNKPELCKGDCYPNDGYCDDYEYKLIKESY